jgi:isopenicillin N synthase-like dioxygenase
MSAIPVIDVEPHLSGSDPKGTAAAIHRAGTELGFMQVVGHGIPTEKLDAVDGATAELMALDPGAHGQLASPTGHPFGGFQTRVRSGGSVHQAFQVCQFDDAADAQAAGISAQYAFYFHPNVWPDIDGFRDACTALFAETRALGDAIMGLFALALGLDEDAFAPDVSDFGINHYPAVPNANGSGVALDAHRDSGPLTILHQRGTYEGLEVRGLDGEWVPVPLIDGAFVINVGELMERWTNDRWRATQRRAVGSTPGDHRTSITTFHLPAADAVIAPRPEPCNGLAHYEPVTQYLWERLYLTRLHERYRNGTAEYGLDDALLPYVDALPPVPTTTA